MKSLALVLVAALVGCQAFEKRAPTDTPLTNDARATYTFALKQLTTAKQAGLISAEEKVEIEKVRLQAAYYLDQMEQAELSSDKTLLSTNQQQLTTWLNQLIAWASRTNSGPP